MRTSNDTKSYQRKTIYDQRNLKYANAPKYSSLFLFFFDAQYIFMCIKCEKITLCDADRSIESVKANHRNERGRTKQQKARDRSELVMKMSTLVCVMFYL